MGGSTVTVGVSIPIPAPHDAVLQQWRRRSGDPLADLVMPHVTLIPPTPVADESLDRLIDRLRDRCTGLAGFRLRLRGTGTFRPISDVVFVAVADGISQCEVLAERLRTDELHTHLEFPYHPHVTVAQNVPADALDAAFDGLEDFRADIDVDEVWVHRQNDDGSWTPLTSIALAEGITEPA